MKKVYKNWYFGFLSFVIILWLILSLGYVLGKPQHIITILILGASGALMLLSAILTKIGCIAIPYNKVSEDKTIQRNFYFYLDLIIAILFFLGAAISWYRRYEDFLLMLFIVLIIRTASVYYFKWLFKSK